MYLTESDPTHNCSVSIAPIVTSDVPRVERQAKESVLPRRMDDTPPLIEKQRMVGRYLLKRCIGRGTAGIVWSAEDIEYVGRDVALKLMHADIHDEHALARYSCEVRALVRMDDPHIARIWEHGKTTDGKLYIAMELVQGPQLSKYCETCNPTIEERIRLVTKLCRGLQHAHQRGILHRDLKPANVLISQLGDEAAPKIIDFGLAKSIYQPLIPGAVDTTQMGCLLGTIGYMSPEQASTGHRDVDTRSDVYSLVVILYELLTGSLPIPRQELNRASLSNALDMIQHREVEAASWRVKNHADAEAHARHCHQTPTKLSQMLQGDLDAILEKGLSKEPNSRYQSAGELAEDLERYLRGDVVQARQRTFWYLAQKLARRHWRKALLIGGLALLFLISWVMIAVAWRSAEHARIQAVDLNDKLIIAAEVERLLRSDSEKLSNFLVTTFASSLPSRQGPDVKVIDVLEEASKHVDAMFLEQPRAKMMVRLALGKIFVRLNRPKEALSVIEQVIDLDNVLIKESANLKWTAANIEIQALMKLQWWTQAETRCKEYLKTDVELQSKDELSHYRAFLKTYSTLLWKKQRFAEAKEILDKLEREIEKDKTADDNEIWSLRNDKVILYLEWAVQDSSMKSPAMQLIETYMKELHQLDDKSLTIVSFRSLHAQVLVLQARYEEARDAYQTLLSDVERLHGETHFHAQGVMHNLARVYEKLGQKRQARSTLLRLLKLLQKTYAEGDPLILNATLSVSMMYDNHGEHWLALHHAIAWHNGLAKTKSEDKKALNAANDMIKRLLPKCAMQWMIWQTIGLHAE